MPDRDGDSAPWLEHPQHLTNRTNGRREKHHAEATDHSIEGVGWDGKIVGERHPQSLALENPRRFPSRRAASTISGAASTPKTLPSGPTKSGNAQCRFSRTRGYVEDNTAGGDL